MYDLHTHSRCSDGSESPEHVAELAKAAGIELLALTDHDCARSSRRAVPCRTAWASDASRS